MSANIEQWDLTSKVSPYLDRHLIFPLLEYVDTLIARNEVSYATQDVAAARLALLRPTHMVDYAVDVYKSLNDGDAPPAEMEDQKQQVYQQLESLRQTCAPFDKLRQSQEERNKLVASGQWNVAALLEQPPHGITSSILDTFCQLARFNFDCGDYQTSRDMLADYISLYAHAPASQTDEDDELVAHTGGGGAGGGGGGNTSHQDSSFGNPNMYYLMQIDMSMLQVLWGRLACEILVEDWEAASVAVEAVKTAMESMVQNNDLSALEALQQRTWLLHWSLFVYWNDSAKGGLEQLVELFQSERYKQAITTNAQHLLRYLTAAVLLCKRRVTKKSAGAGSNAEARRLMKSLIYVMQDCEYSDPIVEFVNCLCVKFDFDSAQLKLAECEQVLSRDFFLCHQTALFMEEARVFVFENYCRIHHKIDLTALGEKLAMDQEQAERWIVDLIRNADLDAKIDTEQACVIMDGTTQTVYEQVMDRTRDLQGRSETLAQNLENMMLELRKEKLKKDRTSVDE